MAETAVLGVGRNEIPPYYTELSKSTVQVLLTSANIEQLCNAGLRHFRVRTAAANIYKREAAGIFLMSLR